MKELEKVRLAKKEDVYAIENCDCTTDCCDAVAKDDSCCDKENNENCCNEKTDCCESQEDTKCCDNSVEDTCCDSNDSSCSCNSTIKNKSEEGVAVIDGKEVKIGASDRNLVELAQKANIIIPAPCYFAKRKGGCCNACVVEVNGEQKYACGTTPKNKMIVTVNRPDLKLLRKERILKYKEGLKSGNPTACSLSK